MDIINQINLSLERYSFLEYVLLSNEIKNYFLFLILFFSLFLSLRIFRKIILKRIAGLIRKRSESLTLILESIKTPFYLYLSFWFSVRTLNISESFFKIIDAVLLVWITYYSIIVIQILVDFLLKKHTAKEPGSKEAFQIMSKAIKVVLWLVASLMILSNLGLNITSLIAGLGIGGIAIAFALQNIFNDIFSSFSIYFDKPFVVGDLILVGEHIGTVEKIGIKTTRLRALQGEEIIISNRELTTVRIQNFKKMQKRRNSFRFGVVYDTPVEKLRRIDEIVSEIIKQEELTDFDRVFFTNFGEYSLEFEVVYFVLSGDYKEFLKAHESILLKIKESFEKEGIEIAFPTQTLLIQK